MEPNSLGYSASCNTAGLCGFADSCPITGVARGQEPETTCIISHNCLVEADQLSWVSDPGDHVFVLVEEQRALWLPYVYPDALVSCRTLEVKLLRLPLEVQLRHTSLVI
jgi:hypothetical protein